MRSQSVKRKTRPSSKRRGGRIMSYKPGFQQRKVHEIQTPIFVFDVFARGGDRIAVKDRETLEGD